MWRLLIVDDNFVNRQLIVDILKDKASCDVAANGKEAVDAYNLSVETGNRYDLILLDIAMPEIDGLEFLDIIRKHETALGIQLGNGIPIIMVTAYKDVYLDAFSRGCDDFVLKPIDPSTLILKISERIDGNTK